MKTSLIVSLVLGSLVSLNAQEKDSFLGGVRVSAFGAVMTHDFDDDEEIGAGISMSYDINENLFLQVESFQYDYQDSFIDRANFNIGFRAPMNANFAFVPFGGIGRDTEVDKWGFQVGLGAEARIYKQIYFTPSARWQKDEDVESKAVFTGGITYKF